MDKLSLVEQELDRHIAAKPDLSVTLSSGITVYCRSEPTQERVSLKYGGWAQDLIASGLMAQEWLQPTGKHLKDLDGDRVTVTRSWREREGQPGRYCTVGRFKPMASALRLPGADLALKAFEDGERWSERWMELRDQLPEHREYVLRTRLRHNEISRQEFDRAMAAAKRERLRLVVDNTREVGRDPAECEEGSDIPPSVELQVQELLQRFRKVQP